MDHHRHQRFFDFPNAVVGPAEAARTYTSLGYFLSQFVGYVVGLTLLTGWPSS